MSRKIFREILILAGCLALFPAAGVALLYWGGSLSAGVTFLAREAFAGGLGPGGLPWTLWAKFVSPYLIVQAIRAYYWSQRSLIGRKWANLYFSALLISLAAWSLWKSWDLLEFMYAMGDIPAELLQFVQLEAEDLLVGTVAMVLAARCFLTFLDSTGRGAGESRRALPGN